MRRLNDAAAPKAPEAPKVGRHHVDPSQMKASELKGLVAIYLYHKKNDKPPPFVTGHVFCTGVSHISIDPSDTIIDWKIVNVLEDLKLVKREDMIQNNNHTMTHVALTGAGSGIARIFASKPILGYD